MANPNTDCPLGMPVTVAMGNAYYVFFMPMVIATRMRMPTVMGMPMTMCTGTYTIGKHAPGGPRGLLGGSGEPNFSNFQRVQFFALGWTFVDLNSLCFWNFVPKFKSWGQKKAVFGQNRVFGKVLFPKNCPLKFCSYCSKMQVLDHISIRKNWFFRERDLKFFTTADFVIFDQIWLKQTCGPHDALEGSKLPWNTCHM